MLIDKSKILCIAMVIFGAGCQAADTSNTSQVSQPIASNSVSSPQTNNSVPVSQPVTIGQTSNTNRSVSVTSDGGVRTTERTTSASASIDANALVNALLGEPTTSSRVTPADMAGNWTLIQPDGKSCNVTLRTFGNTMGGSFIKSGCFHNTVFSALNWELRPGQIVLTGAARDPLATLSLSGNRRASGAGMTLYR